MGGGVSSSYEMRRMGGGIYSLDIPWNWESGFVSRCPGLSGRGLVSFWFGRFGRFGRFGGAAWKAALLWLWLWLAEGAGVGVVLVVFYAGEEMGEVGFFFGADGDGGEVGLGHSAAAGGSGGGDDFGFAVDAFLEGGGFFLKVFGGLVEHLEDGDEVESGGVVFDGEVVDDDFLEGCEDEFVGADGAVEGFGFDFCNQVGAACDDAGLGAAEEFVAGEEDELDAASKLFLGAGLVLDGGEVVGVHEGAGAEVFDEGDVVVFGELEEVFELGFAGEAAEVEVGAVDFEDEGGALGDGLFVVVEVGFVGGSDFDELGTGGFEDVGDAEAAADFDEFAPGDDDFGFAFGDEGAEGEDEGGGAVVDDGGGFGLDEDGEGFFEEGSALATLAGGEVDLEVAVVGGDVVDGLGGAVAEGGAAEVGVDEDAGAVEDGLEA